MPITVEVVPQHNLRLVRFVGIITNEDLREYGLRMQSGIDPSMNALVDLRGAILEVNADGVWSLANVMQKPELNVGRKVAIVAESEVPYGYGRMYQTLLERAKADVKVFRDYEEAVGWVTSRQLTRISSHVSHVKQRPRHVVLEAGLARRRM